MIRARPRRGRAEARLRKVSVDHARPSHRAPPPRPPLADEIETGVWIGINAIALVVLGVMILLGLLL